MTDEEFIPLIAKKHMRDMLSDPEIRKYIRVYGIEAMGDELGWMLKLDVFREICAREHMTMPTNLDDKTAENFMYYLEDNQPEAYEMIVSLIRKAI